MTSQPRVRLARLVNRWRSWLHGEPRDADQARGRAIALVKEGREELHTARARAIHAKLESQRAETVDEANTAWAIRTDAERALARTRERVTDRLETFSSEAGGADDHD